MRVKNAPKRTLRGSGRPVHQSGAFPFQGSLFIGRRTRWRTETKGNEANRDEPNQRNPWQGVRLLASVLSPMRGGEHSNSRDVLHGTWSVGGGLLCCLPSRVQYCSVRIPRRVMNRFRVRRFGVHARGSRPRLHGPPGCGSASHSGCVWMPSPADRGGFVRSARFQQGCNCLLGGCGNARVLATKCKSHQTTRRRSHA